jgi:dUTP pyrophosphatase
MLPIRSPKDYSSGGKVMKVEVKKFDERALVPKFAHSTDAAMDLFTYEEVVLHPGVVTKIHSGIGIEVPEGYAYILKDKSSTASRGLLTLGGVFDAGYQGEIIAVMMNLSGEEVVFEPGQKICQLVFIKVEHPMLSLVESYSNTSTRGTGGFGSTGKK